MKKLSNTESELKKSVAYQMKNVIYFHMENEINENHLQLSFKLFVKLSW